MYAQVVLFDGFDPLDVIAPYEVLWAGGAASGGVLTVELVSAEGPREVVGGSGGLILHATAKLNPDKAAGGVTSGLDLGLYLLERKLGPRIAHTVEELFEYERRGVVWHNTGLEAVVM